MPYALILIGIVLLMSALRGDLGTLGALLKKDLFSANSNFVYWIVAIVVLGAIGYVKALKPFSDAFLLLVIVVFVVANGGFFGAFTQAMAQIKAGNCPASPATTTGSRSVSPWGGITNSLSPLPSLAPPANSQTPVTDFSFTVSPTAN